jgi:lysozyme family protein
MKHNLKSALSHVLVHEGGWADHPRDPGGATMKGVTIAVFRRFYGEEKSKQDLHDITNEQLQHIYKTGYWDKCKCDDLPSGVDYAVFDAAVNSGPGRSSKWLQAAIGANQDGAIGPNTLAKVQAIEPVKVVNDMCEQRLAFLKALRTWRTFGRGWGQRVAGVRATAAVMAGGDLPDVALVEPFKIVKRGSKGEWVKKLQGALGSNADGLFGKNTEAALKKWQLANGLEPDGVAGRNTYRAMGLIA